MTVLCAIERSGFGDELHSAVSGATDFGNGGAETAFSGDYDVQSAIASVIQLI